MGKETTAALAGAPVGRGLTIIANTVQEHARTAQRAEQMAHAIAGEVLAVLDVIGARGYVAMCPFPLSAEVGAKALSLPRWPWHPCNDAVHLPNLSDAMPTTRIASRNQGVPLDARS